MYYLNKKRSDIMRGIAASPGIAIGKAYLKQEQELEIEKIKGEEN